MAQNHPACIFIEIYAIDCTEYGLYSETAQNPMRTLFNLQFHETGFNGIRYPRICQSIAPFNRELQDTRFGANIFLEPQKMRFHIKITLELLEARILVLNNPKSHFKRSKTYNQLKPTLNRKVSLNILKCVFQLETAQNPMRLVLTSEFT